MTEPDAGAVGGAVPLRIVLSVPAGATLTRHHLQLQLDFLNVGDVPIRLLSQFEPLPVFFSFDMVDGRGRTIDIPGAGKADFFQDSLRYVELPPGGSVATTVDLAAWLVRPQDVEPGKYTISVSYHNQYGEQCFRGRAGSEPITVTVGP